VKTSGATSRRRGPIRRKKKAIAAAPVTAAELRALKDEIEKRLGKSATIAIGKQRTAATRKGAPRCGGTRNLRTCRSL